MEPDVDSNAMEGQHTSFDNLLASYPRKRPSLSSKHEELYVAEYKRGRSGGQGLPGLVARVEAWMHKQVCGGSGEVLELGAGTLNHVPFEKNVDAYDVVEPFRQLWQDSPRLSSVRQVYGDVMEIPDTRRYDRILSVAVLE